jgi:uncharacterized protein YjbJ (UPF0337 family)
MQLEGQRRRQCGKLADDDVAQIRASAEIMIGELQERYRCSRREAEREWERPNAAPRNRAVGGRVLQGHATWPRRRPTTLVSRS